MALPARCCRLCCCSCCSLLVWLHLGAHLTALLRYGRLDVLPRPFGPKMLQGGRRDQTRVLGSTFFAGDGAYAPSGLSLTEEQRKAYFKEGYLLLRGLLPPETVAALRDELLNTCGPFEANAWLESDALLDFLTYSPLGHIAAQLFGSQPVHLVRSVHHFRVAGKQRTPKFHYDHTECQSGFPPANDTVRALVKFWIPMYDDMPAFWFVNQSTLETLLAQQSNASALERFRSGGHPPPDDICFVQPCNAGIPALPAKALLKLSLKPVVRLGDVIVHSTTIVHRTPLPSADGRLTGFIAPAYGVPDSRFGGITNGSERECDSGLKAPTKYPPWVDDLPRIVDVPRPECFPTVYPLPAGNGSTRRLDLRVRKYRRDGAWGRFIKYKRWLWGFLAPQAGDADFPFLRTAVPDSNVVAGQGGAVSHGARRDAHAEL